MRSRAKMTIGLGVSLAFAGASAMSAHAATGDVTEFNVPTANSAPNGIDKGPDGNVWFTEFNSNKVGKITPGGVITEYTVPTASSGPRNIAAGPDGNLWFTEFNTNKIAKITTSGSITEY